MSLGLFNRNLAKCGKTITLQSRDITTPVGDGVDYGEEFSGDNDVLALVKTVRGETIFDGTNTERDVSHRFCIHYISGITSETWIEHNSIKYDILDVENVNEQDKIIMLRAAKRGINTNEINLT